MRLIRGFLVFLLGLLSLLYLANFGAGVFELIPDNFPLIGNLDEAGATLILLNCLAYFGIDLRFWRQDPKQVTPPPIRRD